MIVAFWRIAIKLLLAVRYRIRVIGLDDVKWRGTSGILFLPNHPALIDPIVLMAYLNKPFAPRALADAEQVDRFLIRRLARLAGVRTIRDVAGAGREAVERIRQAVAQIADDLQRGDNALVYPAGRVYRSGREDLLAISLTHRLLRAAPGARVVLVRITGLWGSRFSWSSGREPSVTGALLRGALSILARGIVFSRRRTVTIELLEPEDLPRAADRQTLRAYLEAFFNAEPAVTCGSPGAPGPLL